MNGKFFCCGLYMVTIACVNYGFYHMKGDFLITSNSVPKCFGNAQPKSILLWSILHCELFCHFCLCMFKNMESVDGIILTSIVFRKWHLVFNIFFQVSLLEECGFFERAVEELRKKELKIVCMVYLLG